MATKFYELDVPEFWRKIRIHGVKLKYNYEVSDCGRIRNTDTGNLINFYRSGGGTTIVSLKVFGEAKRMAFTVSRLVYIHFIGDIPEGYVVGHKDMIQTNNDFRNLFIMTDSDLAKKQARKRKRRVVRIDKFGRDVAFYDSTEHAGECVYIGGRSIRNRCDGLYKTPFALDGYEYAWDDDKKSRNQALERIKQWRLQNMTQ